MTHLYQYFGILLGCSQYGMTGYPSYDGAISMYKVHKFMALDPYDFGYFVQQVALSAASFGVAPADLQYVGDALGDMFGHRCSPLTHFVPTAIDALQSICITVSRADEVFESKSLTQCRATARKRPTGPAHCTPRWKNPNVSMVWLQSLARITRPRRLLPRLRVRRRMGRI